MKILMPSLSPTMETAKLLKWLVKEGDTVDIGDAIAEIETDKAVMEVETHDAGIVSRLLVAEGSEDVAVNTPIAEIKTDGANETVSATQSDKNLEEKTNTLAVDSAEPLTDSKSSQESDSSSQTQASAIQQNDSSSHTISVRQALREAIAEEMRRDENVFIMGEEVAEYNGAYKVTQDILQEFGERRVIDTPISEHGFAGIGVGAAFVGLRPIVEFMTFNFAMQAIDHIINSAAKTLYMSGGQLNSPIVFRGPNGSASRVAAQHSQNYASWYAHVPGLIVISPYNASDAKGLLKSAIRSDNPVVFLENEILYGHSFACPEHDDYLVPIGKARLERAGKDVTIVSYSFGMVYAVEAAKMLEEDNIEAEIIDLRTLRPLDMEMIIHSVKKTGRLICVDESWPVASIASEISAQIVEKAFDYLDAEIIRIHCKDVPMPYAKNLENEALINSRDIYEAAKKICYKK